MDIKISEIEFRTKLDKKIGESLKIQSFIYKYLYRIEAIRIGVSYETIDLICSYLTLVLYIV